MKHGAIRRMYLIENSISDMSGMQSGKGGCYYGETIDEGI